MRKIPPTLAVVLASLLALAGCGRARYPSYYTLTCRLRPIRLPKKRSRPP